MSMSLIARRLRDQRFRHVLALVWGEYGSRALITYRFRIVRVRIRVSIRLVTFLLSFLIRSFRVLNDLFLDSDIDTGRGTRNSNSGYLIWGLVYVRGLRFLLVGVVVCRRLRSVRRVRYHLNESCMIVHLIFLRFLAAL